MTGATRPWAFGDTEPWNVTRTLTNAVLREAGTGELVDGPNPHIRVTVDDVEISETETRTQAVVALLVDTSFSMVMENRWLPMKRTALALNHLVSTRFRSDALQIIAFGRYARTVSAAELTGLEGSTSRAPTCIMRWRWPPATCGGTPTRSRWSSSSPTVNRRPTWRTSAPRVRAAPRCSSTTRRIPRTISFTVKGFDEIARLGAQVTIFRLGSDPGLARFIDQVARRVEGRVVVPDLDGLGAAVVGDYLKARRRRR